MEEFWAQHGLAIFFIGGGTLWFGLLAYVIVHERVNPLPASPIKADKQTWAWTLGAGLVSVICTGAGQLYNRQWIKAAFYLWTAFLAFFLEMHYIPNAFAALDAMYTSYRLRRNPWWHRESQEPQSEAP